MNKNKEIKMNRKMANKGEMTQQERQHLLDSYEESMRNFRFAKTVLNCGQYDLQMNVAGTTTKIATAIAALEWLEDKTAKAIAALQPPAKKEGK